MTKKNEVCATPQTILKTPSGAWYQLTPRGSYVLMPRSDLPGLGRMSNLPYSVRHALGRR